MNDKEILVVDDDNLVRETLVEVIGLLHQGVISEAPNGVEALKIIEQKKGNLILITDVNMPQMNGFELVSIVKEKFPDVKILIMSGYSENIIKHSEKFPDVLFQSKPIDLEQLQGFIEN